MERSILLIDKVDVKEYKKSLEEKIQEQRLSEETLKEIDLLYSPAEKGKKSGYLYCDEYHHHTFKCMQWYHPSTAIVKRLIHEIRYYKGKMLEIKRSIPG